MCLGKAHLFCAASLLQSFSSGLLPGPLLLLLSCGVSSIKSTYAFEWPGQRLNPQTSPLESRLDNSRGELHALICNCRGNLFWGGNCSGGRRLSQVTVEFILLSKVLPVGRNEKLHKVEHFHSHWIHRKKSPALGNICLLAAGLFI